MQLEDEGNTILHISSASRQKTLETARSRFHFRDYGEADSARSPASTLPGTPSPVLLTRRLRFSHGPEPERGGPRSSPEHQSRGAVPSQRDQGRRRLGRGSGRSSPRGQSSGPTRGAAIAQNNYLRVSELARRRRRASGGEGAVSPPSRDHRDGKGGAAA